MCLYIHRHPHPSDLNPATLLNVRTNPIDIGGVLQATNICVAGDVAALQRFYVGQPLDSELAFFIVTASYSLTHTFPMFHASSISLQKPDFNKG